MEAQKGDIPTVTWMLTQTGTVRFQHAFCCPSESKSSQEIGISGCLQGWGKVTSQALVCSLSTFLLPGPLGFITLYSHHTALPISAGLETFFSLGP